MTSCIDLTPGHSRSRHLTSAWTGLTRLKTGDSTRSMKMLREYSGLQLNRAASFGSTRQAAASITMGRRFPVIPVGSIGSTQLLRTQPENCGWQIPTASAILIQELEYLFVHGRGESSHLSRPYMSTGAEWYG